MAEPRNRDQLVFPERRNEVLAFQLDGELVLTRDTDGQVFMINRTGTQIWRLCDGLHSLSDIARVVSEAFAIPFGQALSDVTSLIDDLVTAELLTRDK